MRLRVCACVKCPSARSQLGRVAAAGGRPSVTRRRRAPRRRRPRPRRGRARDGSRPRPPSVRAAAARALDDPFDVHVHAVHVIVGRGRRRAAHRVPQVVAGHGAVQPVVALHRAPAQELHLDRGAQPGRALRRRRRLLRRRRRRARAAAPFRMERLPAAAVAELQPDRRRRFDRRLALVPLLRTLIACYCYYFYGPPADPASVQ